MYAEIRGFAKLIKPPQKSNVLFSFDYKIHIANGISMRGQIRRPTEKILINTTDESKKQQNFR